MNNKSKAVTVASTDWKVGDKVNIGTIQGLVVTGITQEGSLQKFTLQHPTTHKEYSFVPGGLRKTYEPPAPVVNVPAPVVAAKALDRAKTILATKCRRRTDATLRDELQDIVAMLSPSSVGGGQTAMDVPTADPSVTQPQPQAVSHDF